MKKKENKRNEVLVSKIMTDMPMFRMNSNARLILYTVLKKMWLKYRNREGYEQKTVLLSDDYELAKEPVKLEMSDLKPMFTTNVSFKKMVDHIRKIPKEAEFKTYYDLFGKKKKYLMLTSIALFSEVQYDEKEKTITFTPAPNLLNHVEALKTFAKIDIGEMKKLSGNYQVRGYEFICQNNYRDKHNNKLVEDDARKVKVADIKQFFDIPNHYEIGRIDQKILLPVKRAINEKTKYNITAIKKYKLDVNNKGRVTHYRIDVKFKEEYLKEINKTKGALQIDCSNEILLEKDI